MRDPKIVCLCPTYKRPTCLDNSLALFYRQTYKDSFLIICDDANQLQLEGPGTWNVVYRNEDNQIVYVESVEERFATLPDKYNHMFQLAKTFENFDIVSIWEDDDIYLSRHLERMANLWKALYSESNNKLLFTHDYIYGTYQMPKGQVGVEQANGHFHASWGFTTELFESVGCYPKTDKLNFDQQLMGKLRQAASQELRIDTLDNQKPSWVYRWGNGVYHGSQAGEEGFKDLWEELGRREAVPHVLRARLDEQTESILATVDQ